MSTSFLGTSALGSSTIRGNIGSNIGSNMGSNNMLGGVLGGGKWFLFLS